MLSRRVDLTDNRDFMDDTHASVGVDKELMKMWRDKNGDKLMSTNEFYDICQVENIFGEADSVDDRTRAFMYKDEQEYRFPWRRCEYASYEESKTPWKNEKVWNSDSDESYSLANIRRRLFDLL